MLSPVEIIPSARRTVRRGIELGCELFSEEGGSRRERLLDLSQHGARISSQVPLRHGEEVVLSFVPPGAHDDRISALCEVVHITSGSGRVRRPPCAAHPARRREPSGGDGSQLLGVRFVDLSWPERRAMARRLRGVPPPLPKQRLSGEMVWLETLVTWEEDLGNRLNTFEVSDRLLALEDREIVPTALASMLSGGAPYRWRA